VLTRHPEQREAIQALNLRNFVVPDRALDSRSLMHQADLVVGAGGTMTREAALMGVPTYSVFAGEQPAVDRELERQGDLLRLRRAEELFPVRRPSASPRPFVELRARAAGLVDTFVQTTLAAA
jgi:predicted glycosyltransferase